jgi:outer membrane protein TolC
MLRITTQTSPEAVTFLVEGKLVGEWAKELEQAWEQNAAERQHRAAIIDLTETQFIDSEGRRILTQLFRQGTFFRTACPMIESLVSEITRRPGKALRPALLPSVLVLLLAMMATPLRPTLRDAVKMALKQNPQVQIANLNMAVTQESQIVARSALLPQANLAVSEPAIRENLVAFLGTKIPDFLAHSGPSWIFEGGSNGSVPLLDLVAWHRGRQSKENTTGARAQEVSAAAQSRVELADASEFFKTPAYSADETIEQAFMQRPEMKTLASEIRSAELEKKAAQEARVPRLAFNGSWNEQGLSPASAIPAYNFAVGIRNQIAQDVKTAGAQLDAAKNEVAVANLGINLAREEVAQARDRFQAGVANNIEVITAQDELARANDNQIVALYRYNQAREDLGHATGQMESLYAK